MRDERDVVCFQDTLSQDMTGGAKGKNPLLWDTWPGVVLSG